MGAQRFAGTPGPRCAHFRPWSGMPWPAVELWGTMIIRRSPDRCPLLEHDLEGPGGTKRRSRMGVGGGGGGTASSRTTPVSRGKLRGGRRKRRRPDGCHERARALAKRIRRAEGVKPFWYDSGPFLMSRQSFEALRPAKLRGSGAKRDGVGRKKTQTQLPRPLLVLPRPLDTEKKLENRHLPGGSR